MIFYFHFYFFLPARVKSVTEEAQEKNMVGESLYTVALFFFGWYEGK